MPDRYLNDPRQTPNANPHESAAAARRMLSRPLVDTPNDRGPNGWTRRGFLQAVGMGAFAGMAFDGFSDVLGFDVPDAWAATPIGATEGVLVNIVLFGGNDGLNTVVPYTNGLYYDHRGAIAIQPGAVLALDGTFGLHPNLPYLKALWDVGWVGIVHGVGYPNPDLSHFTSMATWMNGRFGGGAPSSGWVGRWLDGQPALSAEMSVATIGWSVPLHLQGVARRGLGYHQSIAASHVLGPHARRDIDREHDIHAAGIDLALLQPLLGPGQRDQREHERRPWQ